MSRNSSIKAKHPRARRSRALIASWGIFIGFIIAFFSWITLSPPEPAPGTPNTLVLNLQPATPLEEFVFANTEDMENAAIDGNTEAIWDLVAPNLVEESEIGLLPITAIDGLQPWQAYGEKTDIAERTPRIAIIVTDLGPDHALTSKAIELLPGPVSLAFSPYTAAINQCIKQARDHRHEALLTIALESQQSPTNNLSPHTLLTHLSAEENTERLNWILSQTGGYVGLVGLSGNQFLNTPQSLGPIFQQLKNRGLLFVGSELTPTSGNLAKEIRLPHLSCSHVIQETPNSDAMEKQLHKLEIAARREGQTVAIVHVSDSMIDALGRWTHSLGQKGIALVPATALLPAPETQSEDPATMIRRDAEILAP